MADVRNVAAFFIDLAQKQNEMDAGDLMTNLRLQKLLYFAQGWHLARYGKPLFNAPLAAWKHGPVVPELYYHYKKFGSQGIVTSDAVPEDAFTSKEYELLLDVAQAYAPYSTGELVSMSHQPDAPWSHTAQSGEIPRQAIQAYFSKQEPLPSFDDLLDGYPVEVL